MVSLSGGEYGDVLDQMTKGRTRCLHAYKCTAMNDPGAFLGNLRLFLKRKRKMVLPKISLGIFWLESPVFLSRPLQSSFCTWDEKACTHSTETGDSAGSLGFVFTYHTSVTLTMCRERSHHVVAVSEHPCQC